MKKRLLSVLLCTAMVATMLIGCGGSSEEASEGGEESGVLQIGIWDSNQEPGIKEILADFTAATGIETEVTVTTWGDYWTMLSAAAQGGELPDVFWMHANEAERYMSAEHFNNLPKYEHNTAKAEELLIAAGWTKTDGEWYANGKKVNFDTTKVKSIISNLDLKPSS